MNYIVKKTIIVISYLLIMLAIVISDINNPIIIGISSIVVNLSFIVAMLVINKKI